MEKAKKRFIRRLTVMLTLVSMVLTNLFGTWTNISVFAASDVPEPVLKQTAYRELLIGESYDFNIANKQPGMKYLWSSSKKSVATVNKKGLVKAKSAGITTITCKITQDDKTYTLEAKVYVRKKSAKPAETIVIDNKIDTMVVGSLYDFNVTYSPFDASDFTNWTSSNTQIVTVNRNGVVYAKSTGTVTLKATTLNNKVSDSVVITVTEKDVPTTTPVPSPTPTTTSSPSTPSSPTVAPTVAPTIAPTVEPSPEPTVEPSPEPTVEPTIEPPKPTTVPVDENGFDSQNRMVAYFGTPIIDGTIDEVWSKAVVVNPKYIGANVETRATFKALWDDNAIYFLAEVKDNELSVQSGTPYMQDSFEVFLDENNDKTNEYGVDDLHFRVNYENLQSIDNGKAERFYTGTKVTEDGYIVESRVALNAVPSNGKVLGVDLQINEAKGTNRIGTINVFDATGTAWNDTSKFGEILLAGKEDGAVSGLNPYNLMNLIKSAKALNLSRYINPEIVTEAIQAAEALLANNAVTQAQIDEQYAALQTAIDQLILTDDASNEKVFTPVPDSYRVEIPNGGRIVSLTYTAPNPSGGTDEKKLNVYLPYGYDDPGNTQKYNVFYLMHGGGENENTILGGPGEVKELKKIIDNMVAKGDIEPMIIVTPSFYKGSGDVATFHQELIDVIAPLVETTFRTYAGTGSKEDLKASRDHRAFGGFSMGSVCTWYNYINCLDYIKYFVPLSGDCWAIGQGEAYAQATAEYLAQIAKDAGYTTKDYYLFCATGDQDIAYPNMKPQMDAMRLLTDSFKYSSNPSKGNFYFIVCEGGTHNWNWVNQYIYDILPDLFRATGYVPVDENGFDSQGRMVAYYGSPTIDGNIDSIWNKAVAVSPTTSSGSTDTTATFKTLWDDKALYVLAKVKDSSLSAEASSVYYRDSIEIFLDENNDKTKTYEVDDLQFRVNYLNQQSADRGDIDRFYTKAKVVEDGYIIEARVALQSPPSNNKVVGFELSVNDAKGGSRIATLNVFDKTGMAYDNTGLFGELLLTGKADGATPGLNPYDLINLIKNAQSIKLERYINGNVVEQLIEDSNAAIADINTTQAQIDELYAALKAAIRALQRNNQSYDEKECRQIPSEYKTTDEHMGTIERLDYTTYTYDANNKPLNKFLNVYLPAGYDANDKSKKYDVLYLIHGMGENQGTIFGGPGKNTELMKIIDNMIANGELEPMIIVTPTWYNEGNNNMFSLVQNFHNELINDILPAVESKYNTYAASTSQADLIASRDHRAFGGFSMGAGCTWYNYIYCLDYFKYFMPISLYCLADVSGLGFEGTEAQKMAQYLASIAKEKGYGPKDYYIYAATGTDDMAYSGMVPQIEAMKELTDSFIYSADLTKGNFYFLALEGGTHTWNCVNRYLYNMLPDLFLKDKPAPSPVDENGFDSQGRMVANFGTPIVDGEIDEVWNKAYVVNPKFIAANVETRATFRALWDDNAIYFLAEVRDNELSVQSGTPYMQDSFEIFLDENNDKTVEYGVDDLHLRVNYENKQANDNGDPARFYSATKIVDGGYIVEARVALNSSYSNGKVMGVDLQVNEAKGTNRIGTINVFDATGTAWNDTSKFGEIILANKKDGDVSGLNPYNLLNLIISAKKLYLSRYINPNLVTDAISIAEGVLANPEVTQTQLDEQYAALRAAINGLILTEEAANEKAFIPVPDAYRLESPYAGTIVTHTYLAPNSSGDMDTKNLHVYLPYGYDAPGNTRKYNVFYLMHGGGENENTIFGGAGQSKELKRILDNMIANGDIEPLIVVTPTTNGGSNNVGLFYQELIDTVIPLVETTYRTYVGTASKEDIKASRDHRAFGGFSMGSICTWNTYMNALDYIKYFVPLCAGTGVGGTGSADETAAYLAQVAKDAGYTPQDYYLFCATGDLDIAYPGMKPLMDAMRKVTDSFIYSSDTSKGNFYFIVADGGTHAWNWVNQYIYDILPDLFCNTTYPLESIVAPAVDPAVDPEANPGADPASDPAANPGNDPGTDPATDPGADPGANPAEGHDTDPAVEPTVNPGADPATDPAVDSAGDPEVDPDIDPGV